MAETLTYENTPEVTSVDNLNADEQDSLQVGEKMQQAQDDLLAGKYKNAEELEKGYLELQEKLGSQDSEEEYEEDVEGSDEEVEINLLEELWEYDVNDEEFHEEAYEELKNMDPVELAEMHLEYRRSVEENGGAEAQDFTAEQVTQLKSIVGGEKNYDNMVQWAQGALSEQESQMFDMVMQRGDPIAAFFAVRSLAYAYNDAIGYDGQMIQGKAPSQSGNQFRSQQEVVAAMSDPRYDNDPAYRKDVQNKLERSNINF